jgi:tetratricopeptide (TPR) repeat protein
MSEKTAPQPDSGASPIGEISQEPSAFDAFLDANQKKLMIVGILAILGIIGYVIFDGLRKLSAKNAAGEVAAARTVPEFDTVSKDHEGTNAGGSALILKSQLLWDDQQKEEAIKALESFISSYPEHPAIGNAYASLGSYQQQLGNIEGAKAAYEKSAETTSSASSLALLSLGDLARSAGNGEEAKAYYDRIVAEYEDSHFHVKSMARDRLKLIGVNAPTEKAPEPPKPDLPPSVSSEPMIIPGLPSATQANTEPMQDAEIQLPTEPQSTKELGDLPELELPAKPAPPADLQKPESNDSPPSE